MHEHQSEPFDRAGFLSEDMLRALPDTEEELPIGEPVWPRETEGDEPDRAGELGPMAPETAALFP